MQANSTAPSASILPPIGPSVLPGGFIHLSDDLREWIRHEAEVEIGDGLQHAKSSTEILDALPKVGMALVLFRAAETGILEGTDLDCTIRLADIAGTFTESRDYFREELAHSRSNAVDYIAGNDQGKRWSVEPDPECRAENVAEYRAQRLSLTHSLACCEAVLAVIHEARTAGGEDG